MEGTNANPVAESEGEPRYSRSKRFVRALRLGRIITCSTHSLNYEELANSMGVSLRTLYRDLSLLRSAGIESPHTRNRHGFRAELTGELLGRTLTLRETAALLKLLEYNDHPKPGSAYGLALRDAKQKIIFALRGECSAIVAELEAAISSFHDE